MVVEHWGQNNKQISKQTSIEYGYKVNIIYTYLIKKKLAFYIYTVRSHVCFLKMQSYKKIVGMTILLIVD